MMGSAMETAFSSLEIDDQLPREGFESGAPLRDGALGELPADFIVLILCHLSPRDVAKSACVCRAFRAAASFDSVWETIALRRLPPKYKQLLLALDLPAAAQSAATTTSKRALFDYLCANRVFFADHTQGFWLERETAGMCFGVGARAMYIEHGGEPRYWSWLPDHHSSLFPEVARLNEVCWFEAKGETECALPAGAYTLSYRLLLNKLTNWRSKPVTFHFSKNDGEVTERQCFIDPRPRNNSSQQQAEDEAGFRLPSIRVVENGWREYDVGEFSVEEGEEGPCVLKFSMTAVEAGQPWKSGLCLDGIVVRPTHSISQLQPESRESLIQFLEMNDRQLPVYHNHRFRR